jgi:hypothetical protein
VSFVMDMQCAFCTELEFRRILDFKGITYTRCGCCLRGKPLNVRDSFASVTWARDSAVSWRHFLRIRLADQRFYYG